MWQFMAIKGEKLVRKNLVMIGISVFLMLSSVAAYWLHFHKKNAPMEGEFVAADQFLANQEGTVPPTNEGNNNLEGSTPSEKTMQEIAEYSVAGGEFDFETKIFERRSFLTLKQYVSKTLPVQKQIITEDDEIPPAIEEVWIDDPGIGNRLNIFWESEENNNINTFRVYRLDDEGQIKGKLMAELDKKKNFYVDRDVENNKIYFYLIKNVNKNGVESQNSKKYKGISTNTIIPNSPINIEIKQVENNVEISWKNPNDEDLARILIYKSQDQTKLGDIVAEIPAAPDEMHKWIDQNIESYREYYYTLIAVDSAGNKSSNVIIKYGNPELFKFKDLFGQNEGQTQSTKDTVGGTGGTDEQL